MGRKEIESNPDAQKSVDVEWKNLESKGAWDYNTLREWLQVIKEAKGRKVKRSTLARYSRFVLRREANLKRATLFASGTQRER